MRESVIERKVCEFAEKQLDCLVRKFVSPGNRGVPDRMFVFPHGTVAFIEFKAPGKKPTALQLREIDFLGERGVSATWHSDILEATTWLNMVAKKDRRDAR